MVYQINYVNVFCCKTKGIEIFVCLCTAWSQQIMRGKAPLALSQENRLTESPGINKNIRSLGIYRLLFSPGLIQDKDSFILTKYPFLLASINDMGCVIVTFADLISAFSFVLHMLQISLSWFQKVVNDLSLACSDFIGNRRSVVKT